ncbi:MAG: hypothetical protein R3F44_08360 [Candidatus Competibacteraceae bacterium]
MAGDHRFHAHEQRPVQLGVEIFLERVLVLLDCLPAPHVLIGGGTRGVTLGLDRPPTSAGVFCQVVVGP